MFTPGQSESAIPTGKSQEFQAPAQQHVETLSDELLAYFEDQLATYQNYEMWSRGDGSIEGYTETNDPFDHGEPSGYDRWKVKCRSREDFDRVVGRSRIGCGGCVVKVHLDGRRI